MPAPRILTRIAGRTKQLLTIAASAGAADADKVPSTNDAGVLDPSLLNAATTGASKVLMTDGTGRIDTSVLPVGIGADTKTIQASEALSAGNLVNVYDSGAGAVRVRKADGTTEGKEADGFVLAAVGSGQNALVYFEGTITGLSGLTVGARYYLGTTPGGVVSAALASSGNVDQYVGRAISATELTFEPGEPVTIA